jgi:hypothetical protein
MGKQSEPLEVQTQEAQGEQGGCGLTRDQQETAVNQSEEESRVITKPVERKLVAFARRLRLFGNTRGTTNIAGRAYEIQIEGEAYTVLWPEREKQS